ncbi:MAG: hypothetical protein JSS30_07135 [Verrucomicrobia bacterium]|nr:hypothetical protein [Verrucomicrobiota bacterium]
MEIHGFSPEPIHPIDEFGKQAVEAVAFPFTLAREGVKELSKAITPNRYVHKEFTNDTPTILQLAHSVIDFYGNYHSNVVINGMDYAQKVERFVERIVKWPLTPLTYTETGTSIQRVLCETLIGTVVYVVVFCALQVFHIVPTIVTAIGISSTIFLYKTAPAALVMMIASSILLLNVYFLYYLNGEVKVGNRTLKDGFEQAQNKILEIQTEVDSLKQLVVYEIVPTIKYATYALLALAIPSTIAVSTIAYYVLTNRTV